MGARRGRHVRTNDTQIDAAKSGMEGRMRRRRGEKGGRGNGGEK